MDKDQFIEDWNEYIRSGKAFEEQEPTNYDPKIRET